jgi:hypothetical protein
MFKGDQSDAKIRPHFHFRLIDRVPSRKRLRVSRSHVAAAYGIPASVLVGALLPSGKTQHDAMEFLIAEPVVGEQSWVLEKIGLYLWASRPTRNCIPIGGSAIVAESANGAGFPVGEHNGLIACHRRGDCE